MLNVIANSPVYTEPNRVSEACWISPRGERNGNGNWPRPPPSAPGRVLPTHPVAMFLSGLKAFVHILRATLEVHSNHSSITLEVHSNPESILRATLEVHSTSILRFTLEAHSNQSILSPQRQARAQVPVSQKEVPACSDMRLAECPRSVFDTVLALPSMGGMV